MKFISRSFLSICFLFLFQFKPYAQDLSFPVQQQINELSKFANSYLDAYSRDFSSNFGYSLNQGWGYGKQPGKLGSISLSLITSSAFIPKGEHYMNTSELYKPTFITTSPTASTLFSKNVDSWMRYYVLNPETGERLTDPRNGDEISGQFDLLDGLGIERGYTPYALPQLNVGIGLGTEVSVRALPIHLQANDGDDVRLFAFGMGIRHDLSQHLALLRLSPIKWNILLSYTKQSTKYKPSLGHDFLNTNNEYFTSRSSGLEAQYATNSYQAVLTGLYKAPKFISLSAQLGIIRQTGILKGLGHWSFQFDPELVDVDQFYVEVNDPIHISHGKTVPLIGASMLLGQGFFQTELQYAYANVHLMSLAFRFNLFNGVGL
ncbi:DUF6588 family protein [Olivibacter sitiensis]|uniref:DUF6588 family protein n=1 Tax=Olivibacter sitiensis TaxID=376470 RepID=UPI00041FC77C|nr:DUF6588 family protein [Olivibacter sitiensis]